MLLLATLVLSMGLALAISRIFLTCVFHLMTQRTLPFVLSLMIGALNAAPVPAQNGPEGSWVGEWVRDGSVLPVEMTFGRTASGRLLSAPAKPARQHHTPAVLARQPNRGVLRVGHSLRE